MPNKYKGFTLLELIIVIVVASVIMLIVFLAIAQLQRSQRNIRVKDQANKISTALYQQFSGKDVSNTYFPVNATTNSNAANSWLDNTIGLNKAPNGSNYSEIFYRRGVTNATVVSNVDSINTIAIAQYRACNGNTITSPDTSKNTIAILYYQETAFGGSTGCLEVSL